MVPSRTALVVLCAFILVVAPAPEALSGGGGERCCFTGGRCENLQLQDCGPAGGVDFPGLCQAAQPCRLPDNTCVQAEPVCCSGLLGGTPEPGTSCPDVQPCCLAGGCERLGEDVCTEKGGTSHFGTSCDGLQACCLDMGVAIAADIASVNSHRANSNFLEQAGLFRCDQNPFVVNTIVLQREFHKA